MPNNLTPEEQTALFNFIEPSDIFSAIFESVSIDLTQGTPITQEIYDKTKALAGAACKIEGVDPDKWWNDFIVQMKENTGKVFQVTQPFGSDFGGSYETEGIGPKPSSQQPNWAQKLGAK